MGKKIMIKIESKIEVGMGTEIKMQTRILEETCEAKGASIQQNVLARRHTTEIRMETR